jgi:mRNA interferase MazF
VSLPRQGEVWWAHAADKRRPVVIVTRSDVIGLLDGIVVAPITRTVRGIPTEIPLGEDEGLPAQCAASFDNLQRIRRSSLRSRVGGLMWRREEICDALKALADC